MFIAPMLASPLPSLTVVESGGWVAEEKYDGHRVIVLVSDTASSLFGDVNVYAWSRHGLPRSLPPHLRESLQGALPPGLYDGELLAPSAHSYGVTELRYADQLTLVIFDVLRIAQRDVMSLPYTQRRALLCNVITQTTHVFPSFAWPVESVAQVTGLRDGIWSRDGEGLILKHEKSLYLPGKRSKLWLKVKQLKSAPLRVIGWQSSKGEKIDRGPFAIVVLQDDNGVVTKVKTRDNAMIADVELKSQQTGTVPYLHRVVWIEYQEKTPDGKYRHPRFDRWDDE